MKNEKLWFKAKMFGWGWTPISWEGWAVTLLYMVSIASFAVQAQNESSAGNILLRFAIPFVVNTIFLLIICYIKGEKPRWRWGR